jgi:hypothetical protein
MLGLFLIKLSLLIKKKKFMSIYESKLIISGYVWTEGERERGEESRGEGEDSWTLLIYSIFRPLSPPLSSILPSSPSIQT